MTDEATKLLIDLWQWVENTCERIPEDIAIRTERYLSRPAEQATVPPREPTKAMVRAVLNVAGYPRSATVANIWRAMYDAAIAEGKP